MQSTRGAAILAAVAVLTGGLAACGDESEPEESTTTVSPIDRSTESSSSSESSTSSGSDTSSGDGSGGDSELPDDLPAEARKNTKEGAAAFGEYYYDALGEAALSGETSNLEMLEGKDCGVCATARENILEDAKKGWTRSKNPYSMTNVKATKRPDVGFKVSMDVAVAPHTRVDSNGEANGHVKATKYTLSEHVEWRDGRWQMLDWVVT